MENLMCDFCSAEHAKHTYQTKEFALWQLGEVIGWSDGAWQACDICKTFIDSKDPVRLAEHALNGLIDALDELPTERFQTVILREIREAHQLFFENLLGVN